jgi:phosphoglycolate phosphatase-like HAD superfamily hydrolase
MVLVIFDVDGTLVYSNRVDSQCFADTYESIYKQPFPSIDWTRYPHVTDTSIFSAVIEEQFQRQVEQEEIDHFTDNFVEALRRKRITEPESFRIVPGARAAVERLLATDGYTVGIATGGWKRPAQLKLRHVGIPQEELFFSGADGKITRESIIEEVISGVEEASIAYERVVYIGDAIWDVQTTRNLQMDFVGIRRKKDISFLKAAGATEVITDYLDFDYFLGAIHRSTPPR